MTDYKITNNFDDTLLIWGAIGYTLKELKVDLEIYCKKTIQILTIIQSLK